MPDISSQLHECSRQEEKKLIWEKVKMNGLLNNLTLPYYTRYQKWKTNLFSADKMLNQNATETLTTTQTQLLSRRLERLFIKIIT